MRNVVFVLCLLSVAVPTARATIRQVAVDSLYPTIQAGIDSSVNGDTVLVPANRYYENISFNGRSIVVASQFLFDSNYVWLSKTVLDGSRPASPDSASCVRIVSGEDSTTQLVGFFITGGTGTKWLDEHGAGLYREGGGILIENSSPVIRNCLIDGNTAMNTSGVSSAGGGGIRVGDGSPTIRDNVISSNHGRYGAGIVLNYTGARIENNIIWGNTGGQDYGGGGIWAYSNSTAPKLVENNTITGNSSSTNGGGVKVWSTSVTARNNVIWANNAPTGAQVFLQEGGAADMTYSDVQGGWAGTGNIDSDPLLDPVFFYLGSGSPAIDSGDPDPAYYDPDSAGVARWPAQGGLRNDMGVYGGPYSRVLPTGLAGAVEEHEPAAARRFDLRCRPQPVTGTAAISFSLPLAGPVELKLYNAAGREVRVVSSGVLGSGRHETALAGDGLAAGVYTCRLSGPAGTAQTRVVLLR